MELSKQELEFAIDGLDQLLFIEDMNIEEDAFGAMEQVARIKAIGQLHDRFSARVALLEDTFYDLDGVESTLSGSHGE